MAVAETRTFGSRSGDVKGSNRGTRLAGWSISGGRESQEQGKGFQSQGGIAVLSRRRLRLAMALALVGASVAVSLGVNLHRTERQSVLAVARPIALGQEIQASDLERVSVGGLRAGEYLPAADASDILGRTAAVGLQPGSLLVPGDLARSASLPAGESIVGLRLSPGEFPASQVGVGSHVMIVMTAGKGQPLSVPGGPDGLGTSTVAAPGRGSASKAFGSGSGPVGSLPAALGAVLVDDAAVVGVAPEPSDGAHPGDEVVSVIVPLALAPAVMTAAASGQVSLALVGPRRG
jgi:hypothetical protein